MHTRFSPSAADGGGSIIEAHAKDVGHFLSIGRSYGICQAVPQEASLPEQDLLGAIEYMKTELTLLAYDEGCEAHADAAEGADSVPGLPMLRTGFWLTPAPASYTPPAPLAEFLAEGGEKPLCLNFGSMNVYHEAWASSMLQAIQQTGRRVIAVGQAVPKEVRGWPSTLWLPSVPHAYLFPKVACVIHHGGAGTTAAAAAAGVPSVVVPFLDWSDQPRFGAWVQRSGSGAHVPPDARTASGFTEALAVALQPATAAAATTLASSVSARRGVGAAVDAISARLTDPATAAAEASTAVEQLRSLRAIPTLSEGGKLRAGLYILLRDPKVLPLRTYAARCADGDASPWGRRDCNLVGEVEIAIS